MGRAALQLVYLSEILSTYVGISAVSEEGEPTAGMTIVALDMVES